MHHNTEYEYRQRKGYGSMRIEKNNNILQDNELISLVIAGDHNAFRELFYAYSNPVVKFLTVITGSSEAAEDISQDIFAYVWENRHKMSTVRNFKSYLFTVAKNSSFKYIREHHKLYDRQESMDTGADAETYASDEMLIAEETELLVSIAIDRMPRLRRTVFTMSRYEGLTNDQIAKQLNISNESVASHINTAKKEIKKLILLFIAFYTQMNN